MEIYSGVVSHKRFRGAQSPRPHGFAYSLSMVLLDLDALPASLSGLWPFCGHNTRAAFSSFHDADHLKGEVKPGQGLSAALRDAVAARVPGYRPAGRVLLLTHLRYFGYCFNPISIYYALHPATGEVECIVAEVSNTPWGEMHLYVLRSGAPGVGSARVPAAAGAAPGALYGLSALPLPLSGEAKEALARAGAVGPLDFDALAAVLDGAPQARAPLEGCGGGSGSGGGGGGAPAAGSADMLRFSWAKEFHVSPFFGLDHTYDWIFSQPSGGGGGGGGGGAPGSVPTLLVQGQNLRAGERVFSIQMLLERRAARPSRGFMAYLIFWAFPFLTHRVQLWIHWEALKLWWKGTPLFQHPDGFWGKAGKRA